MNCDVYASSSFSDKRFRRYLGLLFRLDMLFFAEHLRHEITFSDLSPLSEIRYGSTGAKSLLAWLVKSSLKDDL